jgi:hypothetical protein
MRDVLAAYRAAVEADAEVRPQFDRPANVVSAAVSGPDGGTIRTGEPLEIDLVLSTELRCRASIHIGISEGTATPILLVNPGGETMLEPGETRVRCAIESAPLPRGRYYVWVGAYRLTTDGEELVAWQPVTHFDLYGPELSPPPLGIVRVGPVHVGSTWELGAP